MAVTKEDAGSSNIGDILRSAVSGGSAPAGDSKPPVETESVEAQDSEVDSDSALDSTEDQGEVSEVSEEVSEEDPDQAQGSADPELAKAQKIAKDYEKGMRQFQRERDDFKKRLKEQEAVVGQFSEIQKAFKKNGIEGLVNSLAGKESAWEEIQKKIEERAIKRYNADPSELELLDREDELLREKARREAVEKDYQDQIEKITSKERQANLAELRSKVNPTFEKYRFNGKLGDSKREARANEIVWNAALSELAAFAETEGIKEYEVPSEKIDSIFAEHASLFTVASEKQVKETIEKKKEEATKKAQLSSVSKAKPKKNLEDTAEEYMGNYNLGGLLRGYFKK